MADSSRSRGSEPAEPGAPVTNPERLPDGRSHYTRRLGIGLIVAGSLITGFVVSIALVASCSEGPRST